VRENRKNYSADLKGRIVLEMLREESTVSQIAAKCSIHQSMLHKWKKIVLDGFSELFADSRKKSPAEREKDATIEELYRQVGKLSMQLEWLKKKCGVDSIP
jgi:putative transposase